MSSATTSPGHASDVDWTSQATADLAKLSRREVDRIKLAVRRLAATGHGNTRQLKGFDPPRIRLRVGDRRVMLEITSSLIRVLRVLHRREAYRKSARIGQEVSGTGEIDANEMDESNDIVAASESTSL
ncbi:MAG: type II toxin-antitoxin system RelE/ParE family toxin [Bryobacterales bacterium]|nr:type II toxin-antitoxin system RelE/ParE family toxin [Bryobacterales bacterium]MDE0620265.1 type II toxin-antitoxin system RelE/ParE family toxin [Bryobacterales bacterium]